MSRGDLALKLIQLVDNMRLRADLGQPITQGQVRTYNTTVDQWDATRIPRQRKQVRR